MKSHRKNWKLALLAFAIALGPGRVALAQTGGDPDAAAFRLKLMLNHASARLSEFDRVLTSSEEQLAVETANVSRLETELQAGRRPREEIARELETVADRVDLIQKNVEEVAAGIPVVRATLEMIRAEARRLGLESIYQAAGEALKFADGLARRAEACLQDISVLEDRIQRLRERLRRPDRF